MRKLPAGIIAMSAFFVFGTAMSGLTFILLLFPGSWLEPVWRLNPEAHSGFQQMGGWAIVLMAIVCVACGVSAVGLIARAQWGHATAIGVLTVNLLGDTLNAVVRHDLRTLIGLPIGGALIAYLLSPGVRRLFYRNSSI